MARLVTVLKESGDDLLFVVYIFIDKKFNIFILIIIY
jgi:hypothetical protein